MNKPHIWLRAETKPQEQRTALTPDNAKQLIDAGFKLTVEASPQNIFKDEEYKKLNCDMAKSGDWVNAPVDAIILGLKELPEAPFSLVHKHIYFAHVYKDQQGWQALLSRFKAGRGELFDLEYLVDENDRRIAAFGYWAGFAGAALGISAWITQQTENAPPLQNIKAYNNKQFLESELCDKLAKIMKKPKVMVIGAKGRSGSGAVDLARALNLDIVEWDLAETQDGGPFPEINQQDILVNCVFINEDLPLFITPELLAQADRKLAVITDVSCDPYGSYNPLPIYQHCTSFKTPCLHLIKGDNPLDLIAIDHLPSLLPKESSEDYGQQLVKHLLTLNDQTQGVWPKALDIFQAKTALI